MSTRRKAQGPSGLWTEERCAKPARPVFLEGVIKEESLDIQNVAGGIPISAMDTWTRRMVLFYQKEKARSPSVLGADERWLPGGQDQPNLSALALFI